MNQLFGEEHSPRLCYRYGRSAEVLIKEPTQLAFSNPHASSKGLDIPVLSIKKPFGDKPQCS